MEVLHPSEVPTKSSPNSQDSPVDLRTGGKLCSPSLLHHMAYPHSQSFITDQQNKQIKYPFNFMVSEQIYGKEMKENKNSLDVKLETHSSIEYKDVSKKKRQRDDSSETDNLSIKRQKVDNESSFVIKKNDIHSNKGLADSLNHNMENYLPLQYVPQSMPNFNSKDYTDLLERLKSSQSSNLSTTFVKETESLLAAVHHSQMLYYSYCSKLFHNLQTRKYIEERERTYHYINESSKKKTESLPNNITMENRPKKMNKPSPKSRINASKKTSKAISKDRCSFENNEEVSNINPIPYNSSTSDQNGNSVSNDKDSSRSPQTDKRETESPLEGSPPSKEENRDLTSRKRASRALTGKHVRHGTGASLSTLRTLRQKLQERQRNRKELIF